MLMKRLLYKLSPGEDWRLAPVKTLLRADLESWVRGRASALGRQVHYVIVEMEWGEQRTINGFGQAVPVEASPAPKAPSGVEGPKEPLGDSEAAPAPIPDAPGQMPLGDDETGESKTSPAPRGSDAEEAPDLSGDGKGSDPRLSTPAASAKPR